LFVEAFVYAPQPKIYICARSTVFTPVADPRNEHNQECSGPTTGNYGVIRTMGIELCGSDEDEWHKLDAY